MCTLCKKSAIFHRRLPVFGVYDWHGHPRLECDIWLGSIQSCMPTHIYFSIFHNSCCRDKNSISLMAFGNTFLLPFGQSNGPLRLMRKRTMPISAKFV